jgi:hypothetical protein
VKSPSITNRDLVSNFDNLPDNSADRLFDSRHTLRKIKSQKKKAINEEDNIPTSKGISQRSQAWLKFNKE